MHPSSQPPQFHWDQRNVLVRENPPCFTADLAHSSGFSEAPLANCLAEVYPHYRSGSPHAIIDLILPQCLLHPIPAGKCGESNELPVHWQLHGPKSIPK